MKTIRQVADEIGVSKQAVYKRIKSTLHTDVAPYMHTVDGIIYIDEQGESLIIQAFTENIACKGVFSYAHTDTHTVDREIINLFQRNISVLQEQLAIKDRQIETLTATIRTQTESINTYLKNELAGTFIDGQKMIHNNTSLYTPPIGFLSRFFSKKKLC